jgi:hypothetical protein
MSCYRIEFRQGPPVHIEVSQDSAMAGMPGFSAVVYRLTDFGSEAEVMRRADGDILHFFGSSEVAALTRALFVLSALQRTTIFSIRLAKPACR